MAKVAAVQMTSTANLDSNLNRATALTEKAVQQGVKLVILPENFAYYGCKTLHEVAEQESKPTGPVRQYMSDLAKQHGIWLVGGTIPAKHPENDADSTDDLRGYACVFVYNSLGEEVARYHKIHLFDVDVGDTHNRYRESDDYRPGDSPVVVDTPLGKLGLTVCYDLRFPELFRVLSDQGAEIIVVPSAFTAKTGEAHWQVLLRARAIENQCFVIGANMGDRDHPKKPTWGGSTIIHPWGDVIAELNGGEGILVADINTSEIIALKTKMPISEHRRI